MALLPYLFGGLIGSPWLELLSYFSLIGYSYAAWRLAPGSGGFVRRSGRLLLWLALLVLFNSVVSWAALTYLPKDRDFLGMNLSEIELSFPIYLASAAMLIVGIVLPARLLVDAWDLGRRRIRWRLTFSYLLIGLLTNLLVPVAILVYVSFLSLTRVPAIVPPAELAPRLAAAITPAVTTTADAPQLQLLLEGMLSGETRLPLEAGEEFADLQARIDNTVRRISVFYPDGTVLASAGANPLAIGAGLPDDAAVRLNLLTAQALTSDSCVNGHPADGPVPDISVCALRADPSVEPVALLAVESLIDSGAQVGAAFGRIVSVTLLGMSVTLNLSLLVILALLPIALSGGYLLARQLTRRVERLNAAATAFSTGKLDQPVPIDTVDEIGRLGESFNMMAAQLAERERALADAAARAESLLRSNRRLVADVSHELRNPLATLRGYLEALEEEYGAQLPEHDMRVIRGEMQRLTGLVDDLFTLARAEAQQLPLSLTPVDVGALMQRLADTFAPLANRERQIELVSQITPDLPPVQADANRLEQVIRNLAQNALRHTPAGGIIVFAAEPSDDGVALMVADTGIGIAAEDLPHVFDRFYRGDSSRTRETGGAGLGLALVHELIRAMGGSVEVESNPGRGSRFTVKLRRA